MFGKMKQRDAEDVLGDIAKQDRRISKARQSIAPGSVRLIVTYVATLLLLVGVSGTKRDLGI